MRAPPSCAERGRPRARRAITLIGLVMLLCIAASVATAYLFLARQSGSASHWFFHSQLAYDLAASALRVGVDRLRDANAPALAAGAQSLAPGLSGVLEAIEAGGVGLPPIPLMSSDDLAALPDSMQELLVPLAEYAPRFEVVAEVVAAEPLRAGPVEGIPADPQEVRGRLRLTSRASTRPALGTRVERVAVLEIGYKRINLLPPLFGRFTLMALSRAEADDPNFVRTVADPASGDGSPEGLLPLVLDSGRPAALVPAGSNRLDRGAIVRDLPDPKFLDHQGWIYLGGSAEWNLALAHGFGPYGESFQLPGFLAQVPYKGSPAADAGFRARVKAASDRTSRCEVDFSRPANGIYQILHALADNYQIIGLDPAVHRFVQAGGTRLPTMDFGPVSTSGLRLFGQPAEATPTLVFGPVKRTYMRKAGLSLHYVADRLGLCSTPGNRFITLYKLATHDPKVQAILRAGCEAGPGNDGTYPQLGPALVSDAYMGGLEAMLGPLPSGTYRADGLAPSAPVGGNRAHGSDLLPWLGSVPGLDAAAAEHLLEGRLDAPKVYAGPLSQGPRAAWAALRESMTFSLDPRAFVPTVREGSVLHVPGVVGIRSNDTLVLPAITKVERGGVILAPAGIEITGDLVRGGREPLALVALTGDIVIREGVRRVEGLLVALTGTVRFPPGPFEIEGGVSCGRLDLEGLKTGAAKTLRWASDLDPADPEARSDRYRVYYGLEAAQLEEGGG